MLAVAVPALPRVALASAPALALGRRPALLTRPGTAVRAGRHAQLPLPHISGAENEFLSRRAVLVGLDAAGRAFVANLSTRHELIVRPWGRGASADAHLRHGDGSSSPQRFLGAGAHWVRNGRAWDDEEGRYGPARGDDRTSWLFVEVSHADPTIRLAPQASDSLVEAGTTFASPEGQREWRITDAQYRGLLIYFAEFLGLPPAVVPQIPSDTAAERLGARLGEWSRIDHLIASAARRGFTGGRAELLPWLIAEGYLNPREVGEMAERYGLRSLLRRPARYRPPA
nr:hypothetical protein [Propionibacterium sp.]